MDVLLNGLNNAQKTAVTSPASVLQVLAPPGSGKTKTLTARVAYLISHYGFAPYNIIVCTFTIKAAREMKERISGMVGEGVERKLILGTFHSVARRFLSFYGHHIGIPKDFGIADSSDTLAILKRIIKRKGYTIEPSNARSRISSQKAQTISADEFSATAKSTEQHEFASLYTEYESTLKASNLLDYDDLLLRCADLLREYPSCVSNIQAVLIDEFQDTNNVQYDLMRLFAQARKTITIVGDPDQSIYGFRSAEIRNLKRMREHYPDTIVAILEENYRSSATILLSAMNVIEQDETRPSKTLLPTHCAGELPVLRRLPSAAAEAKWICSEIKRCNALTGRLLRYSDFAILLRSAALSRIIEQELAKAGIAYRMVGGHRFFDRQEVKLVLDYLRVINQPHHNDALVRVINVPSRRIGDVTIRNLLEEAEATNVSLWSIVLGAAQGKSRPKTDISKPAQKGLEVFVNIILSSRQKLSKMNDESCTLIELIEHLFQKLSFRAYVKQAYPEDHENRWSNVEELVAQATDVSAALADGTDPNDEALPMVAGAEQRDVNSAGDTLAKFLANVALSTELERTDGQEAVEQVTISTIHSAKGLEWPVVFIPAAYEGSIPHSRAEDTDEERRLLYVAMTRAQALLYISCPIKSTQREDVTLSPFLKNARGFDNKGPSIRHKVTQDLAAILRRDCPSELSQIEGRNLVERIEDDFYPPDGEEADPENLYFDRDNRKSAMLPVELGQKRRKLGRTSSLCTTSVSTTMQRQHEFSIASTTMNPGFISAGTHLQSIRAQAVVDQAERLAKPNPPKRAPTGQSSISSFFRSKSLSEPTFPERKEQSSTIASSFAPPRLNKALSDISNIQISHVPSPTFTTATNATTSLRKPLKVPMSGRPKRQLDTQPEDTRYVLLSSSPVKDEDESEAAKDQTKTSPKPINKRPDVPATTMSGFRPVSTFHTTTMSRVGTGGTTGMAGQQQRRTLGMRRSLQGWSARMSKPPGQK